MISLCCGAGWAKPGASSLQALVRDREHRQQDRDWGVAGQRRDDGSTGTGETTPTPSGTASSGDTGGAQAGSFEVAATPAGNVFVCAVSIGGQNLTLMMDTGSADMYACLSILQRRILTHLMSVGSSTHNYRQLRQRGSKYSIHPRVGHFSR